MTGPEGRLIQLILKSAIALVSIRLPSRILQTEASCGVNRYFRVFGSAGRPSTRSGCATLKSLPEPELPRAGQVLVSSRPSSRGMLEKVCFGKTYTPLERSLAFHIMNKFIKTVNRSFRKRYRQKNWGPTLSGWARRIGRSKNQVRTFLLFSTFWV